MFQLNMIFKQNITKGKNVILSMKRPVILHQVQKYKQFKTIFI